MNPKIHLSLLSAIRKPVKWYIYCLKKLFLSACIKDTYRQTGNEVFLKHLFLHKLTSISSKAINRSLVASVKEDRRGLFILDKIGVHEISHFVGLVHVIIEVVNSLVDPFGFIFDPAIELELCSERNARNIVWLTWLSLFFTSKALRSAFLKRVLSFNFTRAGLKCTRRKVRTRVLI